MSRGIDVPGLFNVRDLGGLPRRGGGLTPAGVFIRSDQPDLVNEEGWQVLRSCGVSSVVDLRQMNERSVARASVPDDVADLHVDHDGLEQEPEFWGDYWNSELVATQLYYLPHITRLAARTAAVLAAIAAAPPGAVLLHCVAGRDRTGIVSAVLLLAAEVEEDAILADYVESVANAERLAEGRGRQSREARINQLLAAHGTTVADAFRQFVAAIDIERILAGLSHEEVLAIRTWRGALSA